MINVRTKRKLVSLINRTVREFISLVPYKDLLGAKRLDKAVRFIREHCTADISRDRVAKSVGCSSSYLSTLFSKTTGRTFKEVVLKYRMEKAKKLLQQQDKTITEIAFEVGYNQPNYF